MKDQIAHRRPPMLMRRMAETLNLDLEVEREAHIVSRRQLDRAAERCAGCDDPVGCDIWLDDHTGGAREAPGLCPNKALFDHLRDGW